MKELTKIEKKIAKYKDEKVLLRELKELEQEEAKLDKELEVLNNEEKLLD